jgi:hypothetical protein
VDRAGAVRLRFIHIRSASANPIERRLAVSSLNEIGDFLRLREGRCNGSD